MFTAALRDGVTQIYQNLSKNHTLTQDLLGPEITGEEPAAISTAKSQIGTVPYTVLVHECGAVFHSSQASSLSGRAGSNACAIFPVWSLSHSSAGL
jgi:hypothetical protein